VATARTGGRGQRLGDGKGELRERGGRWHVFDKMHREAPRCDRPLESRHVARCGVSRVEGARDGGSRRTTRCGRWVRDRRTRGNSNREAVEDTVRIRAQCAPHPVFWLPALIESQGAKCFLGPAPRRLSTVPPFPERSVEVSCGSFSLV